MQQPNKGIISPGLKGLMLVQEGLRQMKEGQVSPQGPAGPTLAAQMAQAAQQPQQQPSMMPPPPGQAQPQQNPIANVAQDAGIGAAIQGQQQQQAQQAMMQMAQQQQQAQQQQPAMMASGGIAGLAANNMRGFKEGGVLGFDDGGMPWYKRLIEGPEKSYLGIREKYNQQKVEEERAKIMDEISANQTGKVLDANAPRPERDAAEVLKASLPVAATPDVPPAAPAVSVAQAADANNLPAPPPTPPTPPVARPPVVGGGVPQQGIQSLMTEKLPSAAVDMAAIRQQRDPELNKTLADYKAALAGKRDFTQEGLANLEQSKQEMMANRATRDKAAGWTEFQRMLAGGARAGYAGMGEANLASKDAQQAMMEARANQDALMRDKMLAVKVAAQAESIGDKEKMLGAQQKVAEIDDKMATNATNMKVAEMGAVANMNHAKIMAAAAIEGHKIQASATTSAQAAHNATLLEVERMKGEIATAGLTPKQQRVQASIVSSIERDPGLKEIAAAGRMIDPTDAKLMKEWNERYFGHLQAVSDKAKTMAEQQFSGIATPTAAPVAPATDRAAADAILKGKG